VTRGRSWARRLLLGAALLYPLVLLVIVLVLRAYGERWWLARVSLYLPRAAFAAPLIVFVPAIALLRAWRWMVTQGAALGLVLFPLMGLVLPWPRSAQAGAPSLRVLSYNVNSGLWGWNEVLAQVEELHPDVVLMQEIGGDSRWALEQLRQRYAAVEASTQFIVASKFPIRETHDPQRLPLDGQQRSPRWLSYVIETPLGPIAFYNVHPISPRHGLWSLRAGGFKNALLSGSLLRGEKAERLQTEGRLRDRQVEQFAESARRETVPVIVGGDTNLPGLSAALAALEPLRDGFREAGAGFGYTFPSGRLGWMRLDRIFASPSLRFVRFQVGAHAAASDHLCVVADLQKRSP
jgi:vancomycin resistance protein VanJ